MKYSINVYNKTTGEIEATKGTNFVSMSTFLEFSRFIEGFKGDVTSVTDEKAIKQIAELVCTVIPTLTVDEALNNCEFSDILALFVQVVESANNIKKSKN